MNGWIKESLKKDIRQIENKYVIQIEPNEIAKSNKEKRSELENQNC